MDRALALWHVVLVRLLAIAACFGAVSCYPPIDRLITDEPGTDKSRACPMPGESLGIAAPASFPDTRYPKLSGSSIPVAAGSDLQAALDQAKAGDELVLDAGAEYPGPLHLRYRPEPGVIVIRSGALSELYEATPVTLDDRPKLAAILASDTKPAVIADERATGYRLAGLDLRPAAGVAADTLVVVGSSTSTIAEALPTEIVVDRSLVRGDPELGAKTGIELNARAVAILDSAILDIKANVSYGGGLVFESAPGPILVHDSVIEAAWINLAIGTNAPGSADLVPTDIAICKSVIDKPEAWQTQNWSIRSHVEIDRGRRILLGGSLIESAWTDVYPGVAVMLSDKSMSQGQPTEDISFVDVRVQKVNMAFDISGSGAVGGIARVLLENSELTQVSDRMMRVLDSGNQNFTFVHTTGVAGHSILDASSGPNPELLLRDNLFASGLYGIRGDNLGSGVPALDAYFAPWTVERNIIVGANSDAYPPDNFYPPSMFEAGVVDAASGNYRLTPGSAYAKKASDGSDPGADLDRLEAALPPR